LAAVGLGWVSDWGEVEWAWVRGLDGRKDEMGVVSTNRLHWF